MNIDFYKKNKNICFSAPKFRNYQTVFPNMFSHHTTYNYGVCLLNKNPVCPFQNLQNCEFVSLLLCCVLGLKFLTVTFYLHTANTKFQFFGGGNSTDFLFLKCVSCKNVTFEGKVPAAHYTTGSNFYALNF
jgi:hypothetical protein